MTPGPLSINGTANYAIPYFSTAQVQLAVPKTVIPMPLSPALDIYVGAYEWTIPSTWQWVTTPTSTTTNNANGTKTGLFVGQDKNIIDVIPGLPVNGASGQIKVQAIDWVCNQMPNSPQYKSLAFSQSLTRPRPEVQLAKTTETFNCGQGATLSNTATMTMSGGVVSYQWSIVSQTAISPPAASLSSPVISIFSSGTFQANSPTLGGVALTGNPGTALIRCLASVRQTAGGAVLYTSPQDYVISLGTTVVTPVVARPAAALCAPGQAITLTAAALGASGMQWSSSDPDVRFAPNSTTTPTPTLTTTASGGTGTATVLVSVVGANPAGGARTIKAQAQNPSRCFISGVGTGEVFYGSPPDANDFPLTVTDAGGSACSKAWLVQMPTIPGAASYKWNWETWLGATLSCSVHGSHAATITGSPLYAGVTVNGVTYPEATAPPSWTVRPAISHNVTSRTWNGSTWVNNGTLYGSNFGANITYAGINSCGSYGVLPSDPNWAGITHSISLQAQDVNAYCPWSGQRPLPATPSGPDPVVAVPVPADAALRVSWPDAASGVSAGERGADEAKGGSVAPQLLTVELLDLMGQVRQTQRASGAEVDLDTRTLPSGPYVLRLTRGGQVETRRISVQH